MHEADASTSSRTGGLAANSLGPVHVAVVALAASGPAASVALTLPVMAGAAGKALVFAFLMTAVIVLSLTDTFVEFAKRIPSAGALLAWNPRVREPASASSFGWFFVAGYLLITTTGITAFGGFADSFLAAHPGLASPVGVQRALRGVHHHAGLAGCRRRASRAHSFCWRSTPGSSCCCAPPSSPSVRSSGAPHR